MNKKYGKEAVESLIKTLDNKVKEEIEVIAVGGTALALMGVRAYSRDIDLCYVNCKSPNKLSCDVIDSCTEVGINWGDVQAFEGFEMSLLDIPDFSERAIPYTKISLKNINFKTMHPLDIIISKLHRGILRDKEDIKRLLDQGVVTTSEIQSRLNEVVRYQKDLDVRHEIIKKYEQFLKAYYQDKKIKVF